MKRWQKDRLIGAVRLEKGSMNSGLVLVRRRGDQVVLSGFWPDGTMSKAEAAALGELLLKAGLPVPADAPTLAKSWTSPPELDRSA